MKGVDLWDLWYVYGPGAIPRHIRYRLSVRKDERTIRPGMIYEDCNYRLMVCLKNFEGDLTGVDIISGRVGCCSMHGCGPYVVEPEAVKEYIQNAMEPKRPAPL